MTHKKRQVVLILGSGHCGSTLLDMVLSNNASVIGLGELMTLPNYIESMKGKAIWTPDLLNKLIPYYNDDQFFNRFLDKIRPGYRRNHVNIYQDIFKATDSIMLIDSSKKVPWIKKSIDQIQNTSVESKLIYLKRSPYAVINSYWRKRKMGFDELIEWHEADVAKMDSYFESVKIPKIEVDYDQLTSFPQRTIKELCEFIGISYSDSMLEFWKQEPSQIAGNAGTKSFHDKDKTGKVNIHARRKSFYSNHPMAIKPDLRWKSELSQKEIDKISLVFSKDFSHTNSI